MSGRIVLALLCIAPISATPAHAAPDFVPSPRQAFEGFVAINPPRPDVPVGALWIEGFGPTGSGAEKDNLETVRSVNSLTIDKNLQLSLSLGLFDLIGIDPKLRDHYVARFSDLSIIRVKDLSKLEGLKGEPRVVEALKAGSITISTDNGFALNARTIGFEQNDAVGSTSNDKSRAYSIEARDMIIAIRVATPELIRSDERELRLSDDLRSAQIDDFLLLISRDKCSTTPPACRPAVGIAKQNSYGAVQAATSDIGTDFTARLSLPVPIADQRGGLFDRLFLRWIAACSDENADGCRSRPRLFARYEGSRVTDVKMTKARGW